MKTFIKIVILLVLVSCKEEKNLEQFQLVQSELERFQKEEIVETATKKFIEDYLLAITQENWREEIMSFLVRGGESAAFLEQHTAFRTSFPNYTSEILHITVDGNEAIVWLQINADYEKTYEYDEGFEVVRGIKATGQPLSWQEAWYFNVVDGKFGDKWSMLKDNHKILIDLEVPGVPSGYFQE